MILLERTWFKRGKWTLKRLKLQCPACGKILIRYGWQSVTKAKTCGCVRPRKHGLAGKHPLYRVWKGMHSRCENPNSNAWKYYGGKGISVSPKWKEFKPFFIWAEPRWKPGLLLDRRRNEGNYTPSNCRFVTVLVSNRNRTFCKASVRSARAVKSLINKGVSIQEIVSISRLNKDIVQQIKRGVSWKDL